MNATLPADAANTLHPRISRLARPLLTGGVSVLVLTCAASFMVEDGLSRFLHSYLVNVSFLASLSIGGLFFVILQHLTRSQWSVAVRRLAEVLAAVTPWLLALFAPLLLMLLAGDSRLYSWNDAAIRAGDPIVSGKAAYLNAPFFVARTLAYFLVWTVLARFYWVRSRRQDEDRRAGWTLQMQQWSGPAMIALGLTVCFAAFDWLMSLDPHWFSTIFGIYYFSGAVVGFFAALIVGAYSLQQSGMLRGVITVEHYHDLGKLLFGFTFFWAYIAFSQYLLIWYANIPEETVWFAARQEGSWKWASLLLLTGHFLIPFFALMPRAVKRRPRLLAAAASWLLLMHWFDLYWLVMPNHAAGSAAVGWSDLLVLVGAGAVYLSLLIRTAGRRPLLPVGDPRLRSSLAFHNP